MRDAWSWGFWFAGAVALAGCGESSEPGELIGETDGAEPGAGDDDDDDDEPEMPGEPLPEDDDGGDDDDDDDDDDGPASDDTRPYNEAPYAASHNSYGSSIVEQLDLGVRMLELDVHTDNFAERGFSIGHDSPADETLLGEGNPETERLDDWLTMIADWSDAHPGAAPITIKIDMKDRPATHGEASLSDLNAVLGQTIGRDRMYTPEDHADRERQWPTVAELSGQVVLVLTGDDDAQLDYRRDRGDDPALAIDGSGRVIEVHGSPTNPDELWLWTGQVQDDGRVHWFHHEQYDTGQKAAVALNDAGLVVEVHEDPDAFDDQIWYRVGVLDDDYVVQWSTDNGQPFPGNDEGNLPSIAFDSPDGDAVREVHVSQSDGSQHWYWSADAIDVDTGHIAWDRPEGDGKTDDPLFAKELADYAGDTFEITASDDGPHSRVLMLRTPIQQRIRVQQLAFGSATMSSPDSLSNDGIEFFAENANSGLGIAFIELARQEGMITRLWGFSDPEQDVGLNFPAADNPREQWYLDWCTKRECAQ